MENIIFLFLLILMVTQQLVYCQSDMKSSLTFVIDATGSMYDDIDQVKKHSNEIFETVINSNESQIEDFVLVIFRDPDGPSKDDVHLLTVTKNKEEFKRELNGIELIGNYDCPEYSMTGIEEGLRHSRPGSYIYVATDAWSKDYTKYESVKRLAIKKGVEIVFIVTGECGPDDRNIGRNDVFYKLAEDTKGQVFNLNKDEVGQLMSYVKEQVKSRKIEIASENFPAGTHKFNYTVDGNMKELVVSMRGLNPKVEITDPEGIETETEKLVNTDRIAIVKVTAVKPGVYQAEVKSDTDLAVKVSVTNTLHFQTGFSRYEPTHIEETASSPFPDEESYVSVKLQVGGGNFELKTVQIFNMDMNIIQELILELENFKDQLYVSKKKFVPPKDSFRIAIKGFDVKTGTIVTRYALVPMKHQENKKEDPTERAPLVSIIGSSEVTATYEESLLLKCRVSAFPKPTIVWKDVEGKPVSSTVEQVEIPYDFVSYMDIESVTKNNSYTCEASNNHGTDRKQVHVETKRIIYFDIVEKPKDATIELNKAWQFKCSVNAAPLATIHWFKQRRQLHNSEYYDINSSPGASTLTITRMRQSLVGKYFCKAKNYHHRHAFPFVVKTSGVERPVIKKGSHEISVREGDDIELQCSTIKGIPKPQVEWEIRNAVEKTFIVNETVVLTEVTRDDTGNYRCTAYNDVGEDIHYIDLTVEYPASIADTSKDVKANVGETIRLPCEVDGMPAPAVRWFLNNDEVIKSRKFWINKDFSMSFKAALDTTGNFTCSADNPLGFDKKTTIVHVSVPATIYPPKESTKEVVVGSDVSLECRSHGYPEPSVEWKLFGVHVRNQPPKILRADKNGTLNLPRIQVTEQGYYTCIASNIGGDTNITYDIRVLSPPYIVPEPDSKFIAVLEDLVFRIPCNAVGSPTPDIVWYSPGFKLSKGTEWYDYGADGTLVIKNVTKDSEGDYTCEAENKMGVASKIYSLYVTEYPEAKSTKNKLVIAEGKSSKITCDVPHKRTDLLRWFKDGKKIHTGELMLKDVTQRDSGLYTCRVSTLHGSTSGHVDVRVGFKPRFLNNIKGISHDIEFKEGATAVMDCSVVGSPLPEVTWYHQGNKLDATGMVNVVQMTNAKRGTYFCMVKNIYGHVVQQFKILAPECRLQITRDFLGNQPLFLALDYKIPSFENIDGSVRIPLNEKVVLQCPEGFLNVPRQKEIYATCKQDTSFVVDGTPYRFSDLKCREEIPPQIKRTGKKCKHANTELLKIGYAVSGTILGVYEVCFDMIHKIPLYAKQEINKSVSELKGTSNQKWYDSELVPLNFNEMYDQFQTQSISIALGKWFHTDDSCRFSKRQLVDPMSVSPGLPQVATYSHLNVVPHWSTCNEKNWDLVERKVRKLAKYTGRPLQVWTGIAQQLQLAGAGSKAENTPIFLEDWKDQQQPVPRYLWKVVLDPSTEESLAIIQPNVPDLSNSDVKRFTLCHNICNEITWMKYRHWPDVRRGYTYCCSTRDFESAFGYSGFFNTTKVLYKAARI